MLNWTQIEGQTHALSVLERAVTQGRVHHAYLFTGPDGVGKTQTALALAAVLNCKTRTEDGPFAPQCGKCTNCVRIQSEQHPDLHVVRPEGQNIKISQVRVVQKAAQQRPYEARYQVVVIDEAHRLTEEAANALLKTLEEPPLSMRIILVTSKPHLLLDTIRSRCQLLQFSNLPSEVVTRLLSLQAAAQDAKPSTLEVAARLGEGSLGRATRLLESGLLERRETLVEMLKDLSRNQPAPLFQHAERLAKNRDEFRDSLELLRILLRDALMASNMPEDSWSKVAINHDLAEDLFLLGNRTGTRRLLEQIDRVGDSQRLLDGYINPTLIAEELLIALCPERAHHGTTK